MANRIHSKGGFWHEEAYAGAAGIYPGMLVMLNTAGKMVVHDTEGGWAEAAFAEEDALQGKTVATVYTINTILSYMLPVKGGVVNALIADGQDIAIGEKLISDGAGRLISYDDSASGITTPIPIAVAEEARDLTGSNTPATGTLSAVRIL